MKKHNKEEVVKIGEELFRTQGYHNTGTEEILKKSDYPRSSFYYHFKSKESFAANVIESYGDNAATFYTKMLHDTSERSQLKRLKNLFNMLIQMPGKNQFKSQCLVQKISNECAGNNHFLRDVAKKEETKFIAVIEICIKKAQDQKEIRTDIDALEIARFLHGQLYGGFTLARLHNDTKIMETGMKMAIDYITK